MIYLQMQKKKILPFAANAFVNCDIDTEYWQTVLESYRRRNRAILDCLNCAYGELACQGVKKMFVSENFGALLSANNDLALFASGDVDNHAAPEEKEKIYRAFDALKFTRKERFAGGHLIAAEFFPPKTDNLPDNFYISVDFYPLARLKLPCFICSDDFVDWDALGSYGDTMIKIPPAEALMYICMMHLSLHSFSRAPDIRLYVDLLNMFHVPMDYGKIVTWCQTDKTCTRAAVAAQLTNWLMGTELPEALVGVSEKRHRLIHLVYDAGRNDLRYEPKGLKVLLIEMCCHDGGLISGLWDILFPDKHWMREVYGSSGVIAHIKHFCKVM